MEENNDDNKYFRDQAIEEANRRYNLRHTARDTQAQGNDNRKRRSSSKTKRQQNQDQMYTQKDLYSQLSAEVKDVLDRCTGWAIIRINSPQKFVIATKDCNQILRAQIQKEEEYSSHKQQNVVVEQETKTIFKFRTTDVLINAIPLMKEIGSSEQQHQYTIRFRTTKGEIFTLPNMSVSEIFKELDDGALVVSSYGAEKALNAIVNSFRDLDKMQINRDVKTAGFYLIDGKITMATNAVNSIKHPMPSKEQIIECIEFIDLLYREYFNTRAELLPTFIKWGVMAPWSFILKQLKCPFMHGLFPFGAANATKTTGGKISLSIYGFYAMNNMEGIPFDMANTPARLGEIVSSSTYGIVINEVGALGTDPRLHNLVELLKTKGKYSGKGWIFQFKWRK